MKNKLYLFILFASLAVCLTVVFRPRVADRVLGFLGWHDETASPYVAPELSGVSSDRSGFSELTELEPEASFGDHFDGVATAGPLHADPASTLASAQNMPPMFGDAYSGQPNFSASAIPSSNADMLEGFAMSGQNTSRPSTSNGIEVKFDRASGNSGATPRSQTDNDASGIQFAFTSSSSSSPTSSTVLPASSQSPMPQPTEQLTTPQIVIPAMTSPPQTPVGFAEHVLPVENSNDAGYANSHSTNIQPVMQLPHDQPTDNAVTLAGASIVQPDATRDSFGDMPHNIPNPVPFGGPPINEPATVPTVAAVAIPVTQPIGQPIAQPVTPIANSTIGQSMGQFGNPTATQGINQAPALQTVPQFVVPTFEAPTTQPFVEQGQAIFQPQPIMPEPIPPQNQPAFGMSQNMPLNDPSNISPNVTANVPTNVAMAAPVQNGAFDPRQSQYEPEVITEFETVFGSEMLAKVGMKNVILTCDILAEVRENLENRWAVDYRNACEEIGRAPTIEEEREYKAQGMQILFEQTLDNWIEVQMLYLDFEVNFPNEQVEAIRKDEQNRFDTLVMPQMMEQYGVTNRFELNEKLKNYSTTLERKRAAMVEKNLAMGWFGNIAKPQKSQLTYDDMVGYYQQRKEEKYKIKGHAEWEELAIFFSEYPDEQTAYAKIVELGNRVLHGENFAEVAKQGSHGLTAYRGGEREADLGTVTTRTIEQAVFSLPVGQMSQIIRENSGPCAGFYIVRVSKRQDAGYTPFSDVQSDIQNAIDEERMMKEEERVINSLRQKYPAFKAPNLQQIITMAANAERNAPAGDLNERHARLFALAERLSPKKKKKRDEPRAVAVAHAHQPPGSMPQTYATQQQNVTPQNATPVNGPDSRNGEPEKTKKEETKKSFWNTINPFK